MPSDNKPLPEPMLTQIYVINCCHCATLNLHNQAKFRCKKTMGIFQRICYVYKCISTRCCAKSIWSKFALNKHFLSIWTSFSLFAKCKLLVCPHLYWRPVYEKMPMGFNPHEKVCYFSMIMYVQHQNTWLFFQQHIKIFLVLLSVISETLRTAVLRYGARWHIHSLR